MAFMGRASNRVWTGAPIPSSFHPQSKQVATISQKLQLPCLQSMVAVRIGEKGKLLVCPSVEPLGHLLLHSGSVARDTVSH